MEIEKRHFGPVAEPAANGGVREVQITDLVHRLILFEECTIESGHLAELPALISAFGADGLRRLIYSGGLKFIGDIAHTVQVGQAAEMHTSEKNGVLPLGSFRLAGLALAKDQPYRSEYIAEALDKLKLARLTKDEASSLRLAFRGRIGEYPEVAEGSIRESVSEVISAGSVLRDEIRRSSIKSSGRDPGDEFELRSELLNDDDDFRIETDLARVLGISRQEEHAIVEQAVVGIAGTSRRIYLMQELQALTGFRDDERGVFESKLRFLSSEANAAKREADFTRVVRLGTLERFAQGTQPAIDVMKLIRLRESDEIAEVRAWVQTVASLSDDEIISQFNARRKLLSARLGSPIGQGLRFLVGTVIGAVNPAVGLGAGVVDSFLIEKVLGRQGPAVFLNRTYPSIYK